MVSAQVETLFTLKVSEKGSEDPEATRPGLVGSYEPPSRIDTQEIRTAAVELARKNPQLVRLAHPSQTMLSALHPISIHL